MKIIRSPARRAGRQKAKGFTLVELLVFTAVSGVVMISLFSILMSFLKSRNTTKRLSALQDVSGYVFNELTQEIHWSDDFEPMANGIKLIQFPADPLQPNLETTFTKEDGRLLKNGEPISLPEVVVNSFTVTNLTPAGKVPCLQILLELEYKDAKPRILSEHQTTISLRKTKLESFE